jgi:hypothetical protein
VSGAKTLKKRVSRSPCQASFRQQTICHCLVQSLFGLSITAVYENSQEVHTINRSTSLIDLIYRLRRGANIGLGTCSAQAVKTYPQQTLARRVKLLVHHIHLQLLQNRLKRQRGLTVRALHQQLIVSMNLCLNHDIPPL